MAMNVYLNVIVIFFFLLGKQVHALPGPRGQVISVVFSCLCISSFGVLSLSHSLSLI